MSSFKEDVKSNVKENLRSSFEDNSGMLGQALKARREKQEKNAEVEREVAGVNSLTEAIKVSGSTLTQIEVYFTQISKNFEVINKSFGVVVTTQEETNNQLKQQAVAEGKQGAAGTSMSFGVAPSKQIPEDEGPEPPGGPDFIGSLFDGIITVAERVAQQIEKGAAKRAAKKAAQEAAKKAAEKAAKKAAEKAAKEAAKRGLEGKAKKQFVKAAENAAKQKVQERLTKQISEIAVKQTARAAKKATIDVIKKSALKAVAKNLGKAIGKSIPFVGAAIGLGFAAWKLMQGDPVGAGIEAVSGLGSVATALPAAIVSTIRDVYYDVYEMWPENDPLVDTRMPELKKIVSDAASDFIGKKAEPLPPATAVQTPPLTAAVPVAAKPAPAPAATPIAQAPISAAAAPAVPAAVPSVGGDDKSTMEMIKQNEGFKNKPYQDSRDLWTVGVGHLIGNGKTLPPEWNRTFSDKEVDQLFAVDFLHHKKMAEKSPGWDKANDKAKAGIIDLTFNMGGAWYSKFKNASAAMAASDWQKAANELKFKDETKTTLSGWYTQVKGRAERTTALIAAGGAPQTGVQIAQQSASVGAIKTDIKREQPNDVTVISINETNRKRVAA